MEAVRFSVPISLRTFDLFAQLPYDIRYLIWMEAILTPGIHFLKLVELNDRADHPPSSSDRDDGSNHEELTELASPYTAQLQAVFPFAAADRSYYMTMNKKLILVALTCREANRLVSRIVSRPGNLTLDSGRLVLLDKSWDIVSIEYPDMFSNIGNGITKLGDWADSLNTDQLDKVRRLALRYSVLWNRDSVCPSCGLIHQGARRRTLPRHIYRFAALFRNLETFYFIDCLAHRKPQRSVACGGGGQEAANYEVSSTRFISAEGVRTYFEVDQDSCAMHTSVCDTLSWVQEKYVAHCRKYSSGSVNPENVKFKILACEWSLEQKLAPPRHEQPRAIKKRPRARISALSDMFVNLSLDTTTNHKNPSFPSILPVVFGDKGASSFEFKMEVPHGKPLSVRGWWR